MKEMKLIESQDGNTWTLQIPEPEKKSADLQAPGFMSGITSTQILGIPVGAAVGGLLTAGAWDAIAGLVAGKLPQVPNFVLPAVGAVVTKKYLFRYIGDGASNAAALLLAADALQQIFNVRGLISGLVSGIKKPTSASMEAPRGDVLKQAEGVVNSYSGLVRRAG